MTWRKAIEECQARYGDPFQYLCTLTEEELDIEFDDGYGGRDGKPFTAWTANRVYFPAIYDGREWVESAPRNPCGEAMEHVGGVLMSTAKELHRAAMERADLAMEAERRASALYHEAAALERRAVSKVGAGKDWRDLIASLVNLRRAARPRHVYGLSAETNRERQEPCWPAPGMRVRLTIEPAECPDSVRGAFHVQGIATWSTASDPRSLEDKFDLTLELRDCDPPTFSFGIAHEHPRDPERPLDSAIPPGAQ